MQLIEEAVWILGEPWTERQKDWVPSLPQPLSGFVSLEESHLFWFVSSFLKKGLGEEWEVVILNELLRPFSVLQVDAYILLEVIATLI